MVDGIIYDSDGTEVRLWGVNYYAPFHHNYYNLKEVGADHFAAIDRDIEDFKRMGIDLVRMHIFDREISDIDGNVVDNEHLELMDYLIQRLFEEEIYLMLTPIAWWNTCENQVMVTKNYAYWDVGQNPAFGFSNMYPKHSMIWHEGAMNAQETYLDQLFERKNRYSQKRWNEYDNIVVLEIINEPDYPYLDVISKLKNNEEALRKNPIGREEVKLLEIFDEYLKSNSFNDDDENVRHKFCAELVERYINRMFEVVERFFGDTVLKSHIHYGFENKYMHKSLETAKNDCISYTVYAPNYFDSAHNDFMNMLKEIRDVKGFYKDIYNIKKGRICYEFNAPSTLQGYTLGALGFMMASIGIQIAAYFTYTPVDIAEYNPGWIVHYLNIYHTPSRGAAFVAAGEIFRITQKGDEIPESDEIWKNNFYTIEKKYDKVIFEDDDTFIYSSSCEDYDVKSLPSKIIGRGNSKFIKHKGNSCYFLKKISNMELALTVFPNQRYVSDPFRGKAFSAMANRYIDCNRESVVSRLDEKGLKMRINYPKFENAKIYFLKNGSWQEVKLTKGEFEAQQGEYRIVR